MATPEGNSQRKIIKSKIIINALNYIYCKQQNIFSFLGVNLAPMCSHITFYLETEEDAMSHSLAVKILPFQLGEAANCFTLPFLLNSFGNTRMLTDADDCSLCAHEH